MNEFVQDPTLIEKKSMEIIAPYLVNLGLDFPQSKVFSRIIHAAGDPDYANHINIHPQAIEACMKAIKNGKEVFCDVEMVRTGINKKALEFWGGQVHCRIGDGNVEKEAKKLGITRSMAAMRSFGQAMDGAVIVIGNAPTALFEVLRMIREEGIKPAVIIGIPVGFVGAAESKELLMKESLVPYVTVSGNKGGSPIAAAAFNAILYMLDKPER